MDESFNPILKTFDKMSDKYGRAWGMEEANRKAAARVVSSYSGLILDIGCGTGTLIEKYYQPGRHRLVTVDFSHAMLDAAAERLGEKAADVRFVRGVTGALPFADGVFDVVVSINTLHNLPTVEDIQTALREISRVTAPDGRIVLEFRNRLNLTRRGVAKNFDMASLPQKAFTPPEFGRMLSAAGLSCMRFFPVFSAPVEGGRLPFPLEALYRFIIPWYAPCFGLVAVKIDESFTRR